MSALLEVPDTADVRGVAEEVWHALLGDDEALIDRSLPAGAAFDAGAAWSAVVTVSGEWRGVVTVEIEDSAARGLTAQMLALTGPDQVTDPDIADAVGEVVNMIGGNVKSLMAGPSSLSLPAVAAGRAVFASDVAEACRVDLAWRSSPVRVSIHIPTA